jgi:hypothetical protein
MNLFPEAVDAHGAPITHNYQDGNVIDIDLGKNSQSKATVKQVMKDFEDFKLPSGNAAHNGDDLLDLMDSL